VELVREMRFAKGLKDHQAYSRRFSSAAFTINKSKDQQITK